MRAHRGNFCPLFCKGPSLADYLPDNVDVQHRLYSVACSGDDDGQPRFRAHQRLNRHHQSQKGEEGDRREESTDA